MKIRQAVIPAVGPGTRFSPKAAARELLPIVDNIQYIVAEAVASGIEDILIVTGPNKEGIEHHFDRGLEPEGVLRDNFSTWRGSGRAKAVNCSLPTA